MEENKEVLNRNEYKKQWKEDDIEDQVHAERVSLQIAIQN